jgi:hypothetical protein
MAGSGYFSEIDPGLEAAAFVSSVEERLNTILSGMVQKNLTAFPWDTVEMQIQACTFNAWGEIRSADTFARQITRLGVRHPHLKLRVAKQLHDEMRHFFLYRDCAIKMGGPDILETEPVEAFMKMFDYCDRVSDDPLELIFNCQFCCEKWAVFLFTQSFAKFELEDVFKTTLKQLLSDELFHVANGREAALLLAERGEEQRRRMIGIAEAMMAINDAAQSGGGERIASV